MEGQSNAREPTRSPHEKSKRRNSSMLLVPPLQAPRMENLPNLWVSRGFSASASEYMLNSWAPSTRKQYDSTLRHWVDYCAKKKCDQIPTQESLINYLAQMRDEGKSYNTITVHKAAILSHFGARQETTEMPLLERFIKGIFRSAPPCAKYAEVWEVEKVLEILTSWGTTESLTLKQLTLKLTMILALTSAKRVSELSQLNFKTSQKGTNFLIFHLEMTKNRKQGQKTHTAKFFKFPENPELCPITLIEKYLEQTKLENRSDKLLLSYTKPHHPISSQTVARWIRCVLCKAGYEAFGAHSTRAVSTTRAKLAGLSSNQILEAANWSPNSTTFERFYYKGDEKSAFQTAVLGSKASLNQPID